MHISEVEKRTGLARANIRFYEKQGLLHVERLENGYRDYSEEHVAVLKRIRLMREIHVPLEDIDRVMYSGQPLGEMLEKHISVLEGEISSRQWALDTCRRMQEAGEDFACLDADKYLSRPAAQPQGVEPPVAARPVWSQDQVWFEPHPWRRYLARMLDLFLYGVLADVLLNGVLGLHVSWLDPLFALVLMLVFESVLLHFFAATLGKWVFGVRVTRDSGAHLSLRAAFARTWQVLFRGMALNLFGANHVCMYLARRHYLERQCAPWDYEHEVRFAAWGRGKTALAAAMMLAALIFGGMVHTGVYWAQWLPVHRGNVTLAQFTENYNAIARADSRAAGNMDMEVLAMDLLDEDGLYWGEGTLPDGLVVMDVMSEQAPKLQYTLQDSMVTAVAFDVDFEVSGLLFTGFQQEMRRIIFALADLRLWDGSIPRMDARTQHLGFADYAWELYGVRVFCDVTYDETVFGAVSDDVRMPLEDDVRYIISFRAEKMGME